MNVMQVEEKQLDTSKVNNAMAQITASQTAAREAQRQRYCLRNCFVRSLFAGNASSMDISGSQHPQIYF